MSWDDWQQQPNPWASAPQQPPAPPWPGSAYPPVQPVAYAPQGPPGTYFDQRSGLFLPNGTVLASSGRRIGAWFLAIPLSVVTLGIGYLIWGAVVWGRGQTPALQVLGMRCWRPETARAAGWWWMALREIVGGFVEGLLWLVSLLISLLLMLTRPDRRCLHDLVAGTVVVHEAGRALH